VVFLKNPTSADRGRDLLRASWIAAPINDGIFPLTSPGYIFPIRNGKKPVSGAPVIAI